MELTDDGRLVLEHGEKVTVVASGVVVDIDSTDDEGNCGSTTISVSQPEDTNLNTVVSGYSAFSLSASIADSEAFNTKNSALIVADWEHVDPDYYDDDEFDDEDDDDTDEWDEDYEDDDEEDEVVG